MAWSGLTEIAASVQAAAQPLEAPGTPYTSCQPHQEVNLASNAFKFCRGASEATLFTERDLPGGPNTLLVVVDEAYAPVDVERWQSLGPVVDFIELPIASPSSSFHLRLDASIVLAEAARQIGHRATLRGRPASRPPSLDSRIRLGEPAGAFRTHRRRTGRICLTA